MDKKKPIKRAEALQPLSHDHHHGLLLCWKIKQGLKKEISPKRIMDYARSFFTEELERHFKEEEKLLFPLLGMDHPMVQRACEEHGRLRSLFFEEDDFQKAALHIQKELKAHIRFEERELFNKIQETAVAGMLKSVNEKLHPRSSAAPLVDWPDTFWEIKT